MMTTAQTASEEHVPLQFGFRNSSGMYLTVETFGNKLNINSKVLKSKQIFRLEKLSDNKYAIKSHLNRYLSAAADGSVNCDADTVGAGEEFEVEVHEDKWAFVSAFGFYFGGTGDHMDAYGRSLQEDRLFYVNFAIHPQLNIRNVKRKAFLHLKNDYVAADEVIPWGDDAVITLRYLEDFNRYVFELSNGQFLSESGKLCPETGPETHFHMELHKGKLAFKASNGNYLACVSAEGIARATKKGPPSQHELFDIQDSQPQIKMTSYKGLKVSAKGDEVFANQMTTEDTEQFQLEIHSNGKWSIRTSKNYFLFLDPDNSIKAISPTKTQPACQFEIEWLNDKLALKAANGKYVCVKRNSALTATSDELVEECKLVFELTNRPRLVLRSSGGFLNSAPSGNIIANKSQPEVFSMHVTKGHCYIKSANGKYWAPGDNFDFGAFAEEPSAVYLEFVSHSKCAIRCIIYDSVYYAQVESSGTLSCKATSVNKKCLFEY